MKKILAVSLILALLLTGCGSKGSIVCLTEGIPIPQMELALEDRSAEGTDFALRLFQASLDGDKNTLVSPLSVLSALAMTANGASGETLRQMEDTLGMPCDSLNNWLYTRPGAPSGEVKQANSIWLRDNGRLAVQDAFLRTNAYMGSEIFAAPMGEETKDAINSWVKENTDGLIPEILDQIPADAMVYLVNALAFDAKWRTPYENAQVLDDQFTREDGVRQPVKLMHSTEGAYLEDENATGFLKYYEGGKCAFAALLPNEGISTQDYVNSLTGGHLRSMLENPTEITVYAALPKFDADYSADLAETLAAMGMTDAFDPSAADLTRLGSSPDGNLSISRVLHKACISVAEEGTKAAASTAVEIRCGSAPIQDYKAVKLDRPFVYMLIDCEENFPIFMGTLMDAA